jgi:hypothetical protein
MKRKFKYFILSILIFSIFLSFTQYVTANDWYNEVREAYGGNFRGVDVHQFCNYMYNNHNYRKYVYVYGSCQAYTLYWAKDQDVLYWSGHGYPSGKLSYNSAKDTFGGPEKVGINWVTSGKTTNSAWNADLEWVIFAACSQMTNPARNKWAKTMLGTKHQVHSISGYNGTGPGDDKDNDPENPPWSYGSDNAVVEKFFQQVEGSNSVRYSWLKANEANGINHWGVLTHYQNRYDRLWSFPLSGYNRYYGDPVPGQTPNIRFCYSGNPDPGIKITPTNNIILLDTKDKKVNLKTKLPELKVNEYRTIKSKIITLDKEALKNRLFKDITDIKTIKRDDKVIYTIGKIGPAIDEGEIVKIDIKNEYDKSQKSLEIDENNYIFVTEKEMLYEDGMKVNENKAKQIAKKYIKDILGMPDNLELVQTRYIRQYKVDVKNGDKNVEKDSEYILAYIYEYTQKIDSVPMSLRLGGNKIEVVVDPEGVAFAFKYWNDIEVDESLEKKKIISSQEAVDKFVEYIKSKDLIYIDDEFNIVKVNLVYNNNTTGDKLLFNPVWEIECDNHCLIQIDAFDSKLATSY